MCRSISLCPLNSSRVTIWPVPSGRYHKNVASLLECPANQFLFTSPGFANSLGAFGPVMIHLLALIALTVCSRTVQSCWTMSGNVSPSPDTTSQMNEISMINTYTYLLTYACLLAGSIGHRPRNATVFCPWPSSPFLSWCIPSPSFLFPCLFARCFVAYLFVSSLGGSM